jgi:hypothetical protein
MGHSDRSNPTVRAHPQKLALNQCPLWVISGQTVLGQNPALSAVVRKRTWPAHFDFTQCANKPGEDKLSQQSGNPDENHYAIDAYGRRFSGEPVLQRSG